MKDFIYYILNFEENPIMKWKFLHCNKTLMVLCGINASYLAFPFFKYFQHFMKYFLINTIGKE